MEGVGTIVEAQRRFFCSGKTRGMEFRKRQLRRLGTALKLHEEELQMALKEDLNKPAFEAYGTEIGMVLSEIRLAIRKLPQWSRERSAAASVVNFPSSCQVLPEPYGVTLIIAPWNYPVLLALEPLVSAIAAGNCAVVKPSEEAPAVSAALGRLLKELFPSEYVAVAEGGIEVSQALLREPFDKIFFTGSPRVGKLVMEAAAKHLTPVCLELGGKSPCIVDETANLDLAARRIVWGKFLNSGQTCVAPDYLLVQESVKEQLLEKLACYIQKFYGLGIKQANQFTRIVNERQFNRLLGLLGCGEPVIGGGYSRRKLWIAPTVLDGVNWESPAMQEEIFGPILPVLTFSTLREAVSRIQEGPKPLAAYLFTSDRRREAYVLRRLPFGGGCVNDTVMHLASIHLPFGGVGNSGMGAYHGKAGFDEFSHRKSILKKSVRVDVPLRYPPYGKAAYHLMKFLL